MQALPAHLVCQRLSTKSGGCGTWVIINQTRSSLHSAVVGSEPYRPLQTAAEKLGGVEGDPLCYQLVRSICSAAVRSAVSTNTE